MKRSHFSMGTLVIVCLISAPVKATPYYVNGGCGNDGACNGTSPTCYSAPVAPNCAKKTIQAGMNLGQSSADEIIVAPGTYTGAGNRDLTFPQTGGVARAFTVRCQTPGSPQNCVIDCQGSVPCNSSATSQHRAFWFNNDHATNASVVEGFTIRNGCIWSGGYGGGIFIDHSAPTIRSCIVENCKARFGGGAIAMRGCCPEEIYEPVIEMSTIWNNNEALSTSLGGGGIYVGVHVDLKINRTRIAGNSAVNKGGGMYWDLGADPRIEDCVVEDNVAGQGGGGLYFTQVKDESNFKRQIVRSRIGPNNRATAQRGGGIWIDGTYGLNQGAMDFWIENCTIIENRADTSFGGGVSCYGGASTAGFELRPTIANTVFAGNTALSGGGLHVLDYTTATMANVTLMHNKAVGLDGGSAIFFEGRRDSTISNGVIWYDTSPPGQSQVRVNLLSSSFWDKLTVQRSDIQDPLPAHVLFNNNITSTPLFVDLDGADNIATTILDNNYHLLSGSPCNDRGSVLLMPFDDLDLDNDSSLTERIPLDRDDFARYQDDVNAVNQGVNESPNFNLDFGAFETPGCSTNADCDDLDPCNGVETCFAGSCVTALDDCNLNGIDDDCELAVIVDWKSIVTHGASNTIGLVVASDGLSSEPRNGGVTKLRLAFSTPIDPATVSAGNLVKCGKDVNGQAVDLSGITVTTTVAVDNLSVDINFSPKLPNYARYRVRLNGIVDQACHSITTGNERIFTSLFGDATGDRRVNAQDVVGVRSLIGTAPIDPQVTNQIRSDVDNDDDVDQTDQSLVTGELNKNAQSITDPVCP